MIPESAYEVFDIETERQRLNMLGCRLSSIVGSDPETLARFTRNIGTYWYGKGTSKVRDFLAFCTNNAVTAIELWTEDYITFSETPGTPIWEGGTWYPTTHVNLLFSEASFNADVASFIQFFYDIANYNVVVYRVEVTNEVEVEEVKTAIASVLYTEDVIGNFSVSGIDYSTLVTGWTTSQAGTSFLAEINPAAYGWPGTKTNAYVDGVVLRDAGVSWDNTAATWDTFTEYGPATGSISYEHPSTLLGGGTLTMQVSSSATGGTVAFSVSTSNDGVTWSAWAPAATGDTVSATYLKARWAVTGSEPALLSALVQFYA